ncbi:MAG: UV DNA damage repair endonuclease UvsE [Solirubrobacteraceae bacterium]
MSLDYLGAILDRLEELDIRMYRMATALAPYASHPALPQFHRQVEECAVELAATGEVARSRGIRLSTHPGQYTVLNSDDPAVRAAAVAELEVQASLLDAMQLPPEAVVVLHVGGVRGGTVAASARFARAFEALSERARARLVIENDDRSFALVDVLELARRCEVPVVFDVLHHHCLDPAGIPDRDALDLALATWPPDIRPKIHYSSPRLDVRTEKRRAGRRVQQRVVLPQLRAHADLIEPMGFEAFLRSAAGAADFDIMLEAKAKDLAVQRLREQLQARGLLFRDGALTLS